LLVVYLTLLRPESNDQLPGAVNAEQGSELDIDGPFANLRPEREGAVGAPRVSEPPTASASAERSARVLETLDASTLGEDDASEPPADRLGGPAPGDTEEDSPTGDQYEDEVSGLLGRVRAAD